MKKIGLLVFGLFLLAHQAVAANDLSHFEGNWVHKYRDGATEEITVTYNDSGILRIPRHSPSSDNLDILSKGEIVNDRWRVTFSSQSPSDYELLISAVYDFPGEQYAQSVEWISLKLLENSNKLRIQFAAFHYEDARGIVSQIEENIYERK